MKRLVEKASAVLQKFRSENADAPLIRRQDMLNPGTPIEEILPHLDMLDGILILTVDPGQHGAEFKPETLEKIRRMRELGVALPIEVDGGVNPDTLLEIKNAGADVFACGSYLMNGDDVAKGIQSLRKVLGD